MILKGIMPKTGCFGGGEECMCQRTHWENEMMSKCSTGRHEAGPPKINHSGRWHWRHRKGGSVYQQLPLHTTVTPNSGLTLKTNTGPGTHRVGVWERHSSALRVLVLSLTTDKRKLGLRLSAALEVGLPGSMGEG